MKFHRSAGRVYAARVIRAATQPSPLLARLRRSPRFIVLMLLVFIPSIGAEVACTAHDILDTPAESTAIEMILDTFGFDRGDSEESPFDVSGGCDHCGGDQAAAILPAFPVLYEWLEQRAPCASKLG